MAERPLPPGAVRSPPHPGEKPKGESMLSRRDFIRNSVRLAVAGAIIPGLATQLLPALAPVGASGSALGPIIIRPDKAKGDPSRKVAVTVDQIKPQPENPPFVAEWGFLPATIYMVKIDALRASSRARGYNTAQFAVPHPTDPAYALLVYRSKCKHLGCTVGWNSGLGGSKDIEDYDGDGILEGRILCPCHQGQYDILDTALNVPGTPPPQPLNVIRFNIGNYTDPDGKIPNAANAFVGTELIEQAKHRDADLTAGDGKEGKLGFALASQASKLGGA